MMNNINDLFKIIDKCDAYLIKITFDAKCKFKGLIMMKCTEMM